MGVIRILLLADTHLGYDFPFRPRIQRRRRGPEFFANFKLALQSALHERVDCVVHGGDLLYRSKVPAKLVTMAFDSLKKVADHDIPIYLVPGNHERSAIPHGHLVKHPRIHIFDKPRTYRLQKDAYTVALSGFPFVRHEIRRDFLHYLAETSRHNVSADIHLLCIHQVIEGATVGPSGYIFHRAPDVIDASDIPAGFDAVLTGHIHRHQVLTNDLKGNALGAPVFYPGAIERTSFAEKDETKGYITLEFETDCSKGNRLTRWRFHELPTRPMIQLNLHPKRIEGAELRRWLENSLQGLPEDGIVRLKIHGRISQEVAGVLRAASLRAIAPPTMNIEVAFKDYNFF